jgi:hypothetical protein
MTQEIEDPAARATRAGPDCCSSLGDENGPQSKPDPRLAQEQKIDATNGLAKARRESPAVAANCLARSPGARNDQTHAISARLFELAFRTPE